MYCQQCGAEVGAARFCRKCGAQAGMEALAVPQAAATATTTPPDYEKGFKKLFMGMAFLAIAIFPIFTGGGFWWWMLFPAVPLLAAGLGEFMRARHNAPTRMQRIASLSADRAQVQPPTQPGAMPRARNTAELVPPPSSVTEGTTRLLDKEKA
jgi:hypothetical protein